MKKLMIAAAIVCAAVVGQAAQVTWACDWVYSQNAEKGVDTYNDGSAVTYWVVNMLGATDTSGLSVDGSGNLVNTAGYGLVESGSMLGAGGDVFDDEENTTKLANGNYLAMVVYDSDNGLYGVSLASQISGIIDVPPTAGELSMHFQNDAEGYLAATEAVPEPTSGLLLLLGVAGLALRRRRA